MVDDTFVLTSRGIPHPLCKIAALKLQEHLKTQTDWVHNFGLDKKKDDTIIGKMFGVLVVKTNKNQIGYLSAFSGKLAGGNHHPKFVPPVFDGLAEDSFVNEGMLELSKIIEEIKSLEDVHAQYHEREINDLKAKRRKHSNQLQNKIFDHYHFLNSKGETKSLRDIFKVIGHKNPPVGAGECAGPKLLQYAFQNQLKPVALAEFWWGQSPKSTTWKHGNFYDACKEKCEPIFEHMLAGLVEGYGERYHS